MEFKMDPALGKSARWDLKNEIRTLSPSKSWCLIKYFVMKEMFCIWTVQYNSHVTIEHLKLAISSWGRECFYFILMNSSAKSHTWLVTTLNGAVLASSCL